MQPINGKGDRYDIVVRKWEREVLGLIPQTEHESGTRGRIMAHAKGIIVRFLGVP